MKNKKHIDELFKERFNNVETTPPPHVWDSIHAELQKKKKDRKVIPLWWKVGGVAALLALLFTIGNSVFNSEKQNNDIVTEEVTHPEQSQPKIDTDKSVIGDTQVASETKEEYSEIEDKTTSDKKVTPNSKKKENLLQSETKHTSAVAEEKTSNKKSSTISPDKASEIDEKLKTITENEVVATASNNEETKSKNTREENTLETLKITPEKTTGKIISEQNTTETATAKTEESNTAKKQSIFEAIEENNSPKDAVAKTNKPDNRWDVSPNVAPVYYSSLDGGSSIDPMFSDNSQSGDVNISYGVQVAYNITDRLSIRSGINNVNLGYATKGIDIGTGPVALGLRTINYNGNENVIIAADPGGLQMNNSGDGFGAITPKSTGGNARIIQDISYYEVPLEVKYALLNKRIGINMIGGLSTLFLGNNEVSVEDGDFRSVLGEANNLNSLSFTTNVGVGFDYKISKRLKFNIEPMFKYQLNPYSDSSVSFRPYYLGLYSGLSFKF